MQARSSVALAIAASLLLHLGLGASLHVGGVGVDVPLFTVAKAAESARHSGPSARATPSAPPAVPARPGSRQPATNIDSDAPNGQSRVRAGALVWIQAMPDVAAITLRDADLNNAVASQLQRIDTAALRTTPETRRATPHPADAVFLASGRDGPAERVAEGPRWPREGAPRAQSASRTPQAPSALAVAATGPAPSPGSPGLDRDDLGAMGQGFHSRRTGGAARTAPRAFARPAVDRGTAATPAQQRAPRPSDARAAELLAAELQRSMVDATRSRADLHDQPGAGSAAGPGPGLGSQGAGSGSRADSLKPGPGELGLLDTRDTRYLRWFGAQRALVAERLAFPRARALAMDQGQALILVRVARSGAFAAAPRLYRSSGFADFDQAALSAVRDTGGFGALPAEVLPGSAELALLLPVRFDNPMVR